MLIIWRGLGWLVPVIFIAAIVLSQLSLDSIYGEGFYTNNEWPKSLAILVCSVVIAYLGYTLNHRKRKVTVGVVPREITKSSSHTLFFIPIEYWAIIIPALFFWMQNYVAELDAKDLALIEAPAINDNYSVDFTQIYTDADETYKYGLLKVVSIQSDGVEVVMSKMGYDKESGVRKDISERKALDKKYFFSEPFFIDKQSLIDLKKNDGIFQVTRN